MKPIKNTDELLDFDDFLGDFEDYKAQLAASVAFSVLKGRGYRLYKRMITLTFEEIYLQDKNGSEFYIDMFRRTGLKGEVLGLSKDGYRDYFSYRLDSEPEELVKWLEEHDG